MVGLIRFFKIFEFVDDKFVVKAKKLIDAEQDY